MNRNDYYYLNITTFNKQIVSECMEEIVGKRIDDCETIITDSLKDELQDNIEQWNIPNKYITDWFFDYDTTYKVFYYRLWNMTVKSYYFSNLKLSMIEFSDQFYKDFGLSNDTETDEKLEELFRHLFKNISLYYEYKGNYERKMNKFYDMLNMKYLGFKNQALNDFYLQLTLNINNALDWRGYGVMNENIGEHQINYDTEYYYEEPSVFQQDIINFLHGGI